jgi:hypothetical protein
MSLLDLLFQFVCRLSFGLAMALWVSDSRQITPGFYRNHLYVVLGLNVLASLIAFNSPEGLDRFYPIAAAIAAYGGAVAWLYEARLVGKFLILLVAVLSSAAAVTAYLPLGVDGPGAWPMVDVFTGGCVLGMTIGAMFLGHWYLNSPSMKLEPLRLLVLQMAGAVVARGVFSAIALVVFWESSGALASLDLALLAMRWLCGIAAPLVVAWMAWQTLKIPNTQSATGILYVGVITVFLGELAALVLSSKLGHPL